MLKWEDFEKVDMRLGTIIAADNFLNAKKAAYKLTIDFGDMGIKKSSAQITDLYSIEELIGKQIIAVVNFPAKQIANFFSECLVLGVYNTGNKIVLIQPSMQAENGSRIG